MKEFIINEPSTKPYITVVDEGQTIAFRFDYYNYKKDARFHIDKRCLPDLIKILEEINNERNDP